MTASNFIFVQTKSEPMTQLIIELDAEQLKKLKNITSNTFQEDLNAETFSGVEIKVEMTAFGHYLMVTTDKTFEIGEVHVML